MKVKIECDTKKPNSTILLFDDIIQKDVVEIRFTSEVGKLPEIGVRW